MQNNDLSTPKSRERILKSIKPEDAKNHQELLREIFTLEMDYRRKEEDFEYFENLYHCGFLLFHVGNPGDVVMMWEAKHINMDTGCGFDIETLFGAGYRETLDYLESNDYSQLRSELSGLEAIASQEVLGEWADFKRNYYYT